MADRTDELRMDSEDAAERAETLPKSDDPAAIRAEIEDTRSRMGETLDELGERLNPQVVKERVKDSIREATIGRAEHMARNAAEKVNETGRSIADTIRENPIPAAMIGVGLGWLFWNSRQSEASQGPRRGDLPGITYGSRGYRGYQGVEGRAEEGRWDSEGDDFHTRSGAVERVRERAGEVVDTVKAKAGELADRVTDQAQDVTGRISEKAHDVAGTVAERSRRQARRVEDLFQENPLAVGAITLAAGFAIGLGAPSTHAETELVGETRDQLVDKVSEVAHDKKEKARHVAERVIDEGKRVAKEAAREEGLTTG